MGNGNVMCKEEDIQDEDDLQNIQDVVHLNTYLLCK
jgi:hypothetical protein